MNMRGAMAYRACVTCTRSTGEPPTRIGDLLVVICRTCIEDLTRKRAAVTAALAEVVRS